MYRFDQRRGGGHDASFFCKHSAQLRNPTFGSCHLRFGAVIPTSSNPALIISLGLRLPSAPIPGTLPVYIASASRTLACKLNLEATTQMTAARGRFATNACRPAIAYSRVGTGRTPSAVPSSSNFPASDLDSRPGLIVLIAQSCRGFSSPPFGRSARLPHEATLAAANDVCELRRKLRRSSAAVATSREGQRSPNFHPLAFEESCLRHHTTTRRGALAASCIAASCIQQRRPAPPRNRPNWPSS